MIATTAHINGAADYLRSLGMGRVVSGLPDSDEQIGTWSLEQALTMALGWLDEQAQYDTPAADEPAVVHTTTVTWGDVAVELELLLDGTVRWHRASPAAGEDGS